MVVQTLRQQQPDRVRREERTLLSVVVAPDVEGASPGQALSAGYAVGGQEHATARGPGRLINSSFLHRQTTRVDVIDVIVQDLTLGVAKYFLFLTRESAAP
jgi:hypothetical protein